MKIEFTTFGLPVAKGRPRFARRGSFMVAYTDKKTKEAENDFKLQSLKYKPETPLEGALRLELVFCKIKPKSMSKKVTQWITKIDLDNAIKLVEDAMNGIFWHDDSQIVEIIAEKRYADANSTSIVIETIE